MTKELKRELMKFINDVSDIQNDWCELDMTDCEECFKFENQLVDLRKRAWDLKDVMVLAPTVD
jgi:hypothetical protein